MSAETEQEEYIPLQNHFSETLRDILENGTVKASQISAATGIPAPHLSEMKAGRRRITPENDLRLSRYLGISPGFFSKLQLDYELERAKRKHISEINSIEPIPLPSID